MQRSQSGGFTLIEVLVALFVLALGVAGAASTQLSSARLRQQAALESEAVQLAASLGARMRVNAAQMALPDASNSYLGFDYDAAGGEPDASSAECFGTSCNPAQLAAFDLYEAARIVYGAFPGGRIAVCRDAAGWNAASTSFEWTCSGGLGAPVVVKLGWHTPGASTAPLLVVMVVAA